MTVAIVQRNKFAAVSHVMQMAKVFQHAQDSFTLRFHNCCCDSCSFALVPVVSSSSSRSPIRSAKKYTYKPVYASQSALAPVVLKSRGSATTRGSQQGHWRGSRVTWSAFLTCSRVQQNAPVSIATRAVTIATGTVTMVTSAWIGTIGATKRVYWTGAILNSRWHTPRDSSKVL